MRSLQSVVPLAGKSHSLAYVFLVFTETINSRRFPSPLLCSCAWLPEVAKFLPRTYRLAWSTSVLASAHFRPFSSFLLNVLVSGSVIYQFSFSYTLADMADQFDSFAFTSLYHTYLVSCLCSHSSWTFLSGNVLLPSFQASYSSYWHDQLQSLFLFLFFNAELSTALIVGLPKWSCFWKCHLAKLTKLILLAGMTDRTTHYLTSSFSVTSSPFLPFL